MSYQSNYRAWKNDPEAYWLNAAKDVDWISEPEHALFDADAPHYSWFNDAKVNTCFNAVDRHVIAGNGEKDAIIYDSPVTQTKARYSYHQLLDQVSLLAGVLQARGVQKGDRVVIYMPMIPQAIFAMLACARIGAIHSVVFGGFAAGELATRITDAQPKAILAGSCGIEPSGVISYKPLLDHAIELSDHKPDFCVIYQREAEKAKLQSGRDLDWEEEIAKATPADCVSVGGNDPAYILYTSGTTGQPKGVVRPTAGHIVALVWTMKHVYNVTPEDVYWAASDVGWVVGHSYICYAPLFFGATTVLYEGKPVGTPDAGAFWRMIEEYRIKVLFTAPTALRAIKRMDPKGAFAKDYDTSSLASLFLAGERADPDTIKWAKETLDVPIVDHWWQTETGYAVASNPLGIEAMPIKFGSPTVAMPGYDVRILDENGAEKPIGELGAIAIKLPLPPGTLSGLWNAKERFEQSYLTTFEGYYETGDAGYIDEDGYVFIMARTDDVINVAGHRLSSGQMEEVLSNHPDVAECAVIGAADSLKGQIPVGLMVLNSGTQKPEDEVVSEVIASVRAEIGPVAAFKTALVVSRLPKTRSGKILRGTIAKIADGAEWKMPATIDDPSVLSEISSTLKAAGFDV